MCVIRSLAAHMWSTNADDGKHALRNRRPQRLNRAQNVPAQYSRAHRIYVDVVVYTLVAVWHLRFMWPQRSATGVPLFLCGIHSHSDVMQNNMWWGKTQNVVGCIHSGQEKAPRWAGKSKRRECAFQCVLPKRVGKRNYVLWSINLYVSRKCFGHLGVRNVWNTDCLFSH